MQHLRLYLSVRTDNRGALAVVSSLKGSGSALTLVARELALDLASCTYFPHVLEQLPGGRGSFYLRQEEGSEFSSEDECSDAGETVVATNTTADADSCHSQPRENGRQIRCSIQSRAESTYV